MIRCPFSLQSGLGLLLLLGGCVSNSPVEERAEFMASPAIDRTIARTAEEEARIFRGSWPDDHWWRQFRSPDLDRLMEKALNGSPSLKKAADRLRDSEALARVEGARLLPLIDSDIGMRQSRIPSHGVAASYNSNLAGREKTMAFVNPFSFRYEFDFWGKNRAALEAVLGEASALAAELAEARLLLTAAVTRSFIRGVSLAQQVDLARQMVGQRRELLQLAESRFRFGIDTDDAVKRATIDLETATIREAATQARLALQQNLLARLSGEGPDSTHEMFDGKTVVLPKGVTLPARLPVELLAHRPDLAAAMHRAAAAAERIHVAKAQFLPSVDLTVLAGLEASASATHVTKLASFLFRSSAFNYQVMPGVHLPLFEGGRLRGHLEAARSEYDEAVELYNETLLQAVQQVADSLSNWKQTRAIVDAQNRLLMASRRELALVRMRSRSGLNDRREILTYANSLLEQQFASKTLEADYLSAMVDVLQALGGGYSNAVDLAVSRPSPERALTVSETVTPAWMLDDLADRLESSH